MARTPFLEQKASLRGLGVGFIAVMLFFLWLTYAVFTQKFIDSVPVTLTTSHAGASLPDNADVKLKGMIVGEVRSIKPTATGVKMTIAMQPKVMKLIPRDVTAEIVPKTLFGEKYISLIPPKDSNGQVLQAGDNISQAIVPIEVETLLNDLYPVLEAVQPAELSYTLTAISTALSGRGEQLGASLVSLNDYLQKINPDVPTIVTDLTKLGRVSDTYAAAMPQLGRLLRNSVVTGNTVVAKRAQLQAFYDEGTKLSNTLADFLDENGDNIVTLAHEGRPVLQVIAQYSGTFPCLLEGLTKLSPHLDSTFRGGGVHINLELEPLTEEPSGYTLDEHATIPSKSVIDAQPAAAPSCHTLPDPPYSQSNPTPNPPFEVFKLLGIKTDHTKFADPRAAVANDTLVDMVQPSADGVDTATQRSDLKALLGASLGLSRADVPDLGSLLVGPMFRGSKVNISEAR
ncbi:MAG: MCE family protein [Aeromicrobium sp.]